MEYKIIKTKKRTIYAPDKELKKKQTKAKYEEIRAKYPEVELLETPKATSSLPPLVK